VHLCFCACCLDISATELSISVQYSVIRSLILQCIVSVRIRFQCRIFYHHRPILRHEFFYVFLYLRFPHFSLTNPLDLRMDSAGSSLVWPWKLATAQTAAETSLGREGVDGHFPSGQISTRIITHWHRSPYDKSYPHRHSPALHVVIHCQVRKRDLKYETAINMFTNYYQLLLLRVQSQAAERIHHDTAWFSQLASAFFFGDVSAIVIATFARVDSMCFVRVRCHCDCHHRYLKNIFLAFSEYYVPFKILSCVYDLYARR